MHYYQFNIGDYASHTSRLSPMEDLAYRRLIDLYYLNEQPLNGCATDVAREIGLIEHACSVEYVLGKFFTNEENSFRQKRIDFEIKKYKSNAKNKSKAGKASAKARKDKALSVVTGVEQTLNEKATDEQLNINHKPRTINQEPLTKEKKKTMPAKASGTNSKIKYTSDDLDFAEWFYSGLVVINPEHKRPDIEKWADVIRLIRTVNKKTYKEMSDLFVWVGNSEFWVSIILSPASLRKHWDKLTIQMNQDLNNSMPKQFGKATQQTIKNIADVELD